VETYFTPMILTLIGLVVIVIFMLIGFNRMLKMQREQLKNIAEDGKTLQKKEKIVLAAAFANELTENKIKGEAFVTIYTELLRTLREMERAAPYEQTGDFIHQHPPLSRTTFDDNVEKLSLFGPKLAGDLTTTYAAFRSEPQYFTLETTMPRAAAIRIVEMVIDDAQKTLEPIEALAAAMNVIVRDGNKKADQ